MTDTGTIAVPNLVSLTQSAAEAKLKDAGLMVGTVTRVGSGTMPTGNVSSTNPPAGTLVSSGSTVNLEVSSGPAQVAVPDLVTLTQSAADAKLKSAGLVLGAVTTVDSATVPIGSVSSANPAAGTLVNSGSAVNLAVAGPAKKVAVPDVVGLTRPAAEAILKSAGLMVGPVKTQHSDSVPANGISNTNPDAGTLVSPATAVELELSNGPEPNWTQYVTTGLFGLLGIIVLGVIVYIVTQNGQEFLNKLADKEVARGLITFLIAIATVGIAIILAISTLVLTEGDAGDKRFDRGKQVLSVLIGVLGTIVGFYFGSAPDNVKPRTPTEQTVAHQITTTTLPDGAANKAYPLTTLQTTGLKAPLKWSVIPALPNGLTLDVGAGTIKGIPTAALPKTPFTFTVTDSAVPAVTATADLELEVK